MRHHARNQLKWSGRAGKEGVAPQPAKPAAKQSWQAADLVCAGPIPSTRKFPVPNRLRKQAL